MEPSMGGRYACHPWRSVSKLLSSQLLLQPQQEQPLKHPPQRGATSSRCYPSCAYAIRQQTRDPPRHKPATAVNSSLRHRPSTSAMMNTIYRILCVRTHPRAGRTPKRTRQVYLYTIYAAGESGHRLHRTDDECGEAAILKVTFGVRRNFSWADGLRARERGKVSAQDSWWADRFFSCIDNDS